jgi:NitT/TauT family transport system substrate-binding protein
MLLAVLCALALPPRAQAGSVSVGVVTWIGYGPIYCAAANGYYKKYGLDVKLVTFADNSVMAGALQGGELDATTLTYDQVLAANARGWRLKVVMPIDYSVGGDAILAVNQIRDVKQLKGHKVAFMSASPSDFLLGYALARDGLSQKDISPVNTTPEGVVGILAGGSVDVGVTYEPNVSVLAKSGGGHRFHVLMSSREARGMITDVLALKESVIAKDPQLVSGLIRGTLDGLAFMQAEPGKAAAIIAKTLEITPAEVAEQLANIENPPLPHLGDVFKKGDTLPSFFASGKIISDILRREGQIESTPSIDGSFDASFVTALQHASGTTL